LVIGWGVDTFLGGKGMVAPTCGDWRLLENPRGVPSGRPVPRLVFLDPPKVRTSLRVAGVLLQRRLKTRPGFRRSPKFPQRDASVHERAGIVPPEGDRPLKVPFGEEIAALPDYNSHMFTGHERDKGTGLDYMLARYYGPSFGRFASVDPRYGNVFAPVSWNRYSYAANDPIAFTDPTGRDEESETKKKKDWMPKLVRDGIRGIQRMSPMNIQPQGAMMVDKETSDKIDRVTSAGEWVHDSIVLSDHVAGYLEKRGWTKEQVDDTVSNPDKIAKSPGDTTDLDWDMKSGEEPPPATTYVSEDGDFVVVSDETGKVIQVSNKNSDKEWKPPIAEGEELGDPPERKSDKQLINQYWWIDRSHPWSS